MSSLGIPAALKIFKDVKRSDGKYQNPGRGTHGTPGWLTYEADRIVTYHVERDQDVFNALLTSDKFFVYHNMPEEQGNQLLTEWSEVYERLKDSPWKTEPQKVLDENLEFLKERKGMRIVDNSKPGELVNYMHFFDESFGQGRKPFTRILRRTATHTTTHLFTVCHQHRVLVDMAVGNLPDTKATALN